MKKRIVKHFNGDVLITSASVKADIVTHKTNVSAILHEVLEKREARSEEAQKFAIIRVAAKLLQSEIKEMKTCKDTYIIGKDLSFLETHIDYLPDTLRCRLEEMFVGCQKNLRIASIGQCIVQAVRPRAVICPLQLALSVQLDHHFSSRFLTDTLNALGYSSSYSEMQLFKRSAAACKEDSFDDMVEGQLVNT